MASDQEYLAQLESEQAPEAQTSQEQPAKTEEELYGLAYGNQALKVPASAEVELVHSGKPIKVPYSKIINAYRQNAHLEDKYKAFNTERDALTQQQGDFEKFKTFHDKFGHLQDWSESNPDEFQAVWDGYQNRAKIGIEAKMGGDESQSPLIDEIAGLKKMVNELTEYRTQQEAHVEEQRSQKDVADVKVDIAKFKEDFPELNLDERDDQGVLNWAKVVNFGVQQGIPTFRAAALQYYEPQLLDIIKARARDEAVKGIKKDAKAGVISRSDTPQMTNQGKVPQVDHKNLSWDQIGEIARESYDQMSAQGD